MSYDEAGPPAGERLDWARRFAARTALGGGEMTAILSLAGSADTITFSGGFPAWETFPVDLMGPIIAELLSRDPARTLQYTPTEGLATSRTAVADLVAATQGVRPEPADVLVTSGGIDALALLSRVFLDPGDTVVVEAPTYLGALIGFAESQVDVVGVPMDADGMRVDDLEHLLAARISRPVPKLCYVIPDYQNPTGLSLTLERRRALVELCRRHGILIVEDVAYRELGFGGAPPPSLWSLGPDVVVQIGTFSKILFPGTRLGWAVGPHEVVAATAVAKQNSDQCAGALGQQIMRAVVTGGYFPAHLARARALYESRAIAMLDALDRYMPAGVQWTRPRGGFFVWLTASEGTNMGHLATESQKEKVAFVPGGPFYADGRGTNQARLAFSSVPVVRIEEGVLRLARIFAAGLHAGSSDAPGRRSPPPTPLTAAGGTAAARGGH
ncbi:MAG TPA: PLP-dependent aminotransferase family protein [Acidimicrobiales bacterium]|nr:PLP-dependent aminotransferase family protein [Acidimicrobiales bacterium]